MHKWTAERNLNMVHHGVLLLKSLEIWMVKLHQGVRNRSNLGEDNYLAGLDQFYFGFWSPSLTACSMTSSGSMHCRTVTCKLPCDIADQSERRWEELSDLYIYLKRSRKHTCAVMITAGDFFSVFHLVLYICLRLYHLSKALKSLVSSNVLFCKKIPFFNLTIEIWGVIQSGLELSEM